MNCLRLCCLLICLSSFSFGQESQIYTEAPIKVEGFAILAWDSITGDLGIAVGSNVVSVGARAVHARGGVGSIVTLASQATRYGSAGLQLLEQGLTAQQTFDSIAREDSGKEERQVAILRANGESFSFTGSKCLTYAVGLTGKGYVIIANSVGGADLAISAEKAILSDQTNLAHSLLAALEAGSTKVNVNLRSAALLIVRDRGERGCFDDRYIDLRIDDDPSPIQNLRKLYELWQGSYLFDDEWKSIDEFNAERKFEVARAQLKRVVASMNEELRLKPDDPETLSRIALALATHNVDKPRALELAQRASGLAPASPGILNILAECNFQLNHFDDAIAIEAKLLASDPSNEIYRHQLMKFQTAKEKGAH